MTAVTIIDRFRMLEMRGADEDEPEPDKDPTVLLARYEEALINIARRSKSHSGSTTSNQRRARACEALGITVEQTGSADTILAAMTSTPYDPDAAYQEELHARFSALEMRGQDEKAGVAAPAQKTQSHRNEPCTTCVATHCAHGRAKRCKKSPLPGPAPDPEDPAPVADDEEKAPGPMGMRELVLVHQAMELINCNGDSDDPRPHQERVDTWLRRAREVLGPEDLAPEEDAVRFPRRPVTEEDPAHRHCGNDSDGADCWHVLPVMIYVAPQKWKCERCGRIIDRASATAPEGE